MFNKSKTKGFIELTHQNNTFCKNVKGKSMEGAKNSLNKNILKLCKKFKIEGEIQVHYYIEDGNGFFDNEEVFLTVSNGIITVEEE